MDVDIDFKPDFNPSKYFEEGVLASRIENGEIRKHPAGVYFQKIPVDKLSGLAAIPHKEAEQMGYFKIDMLHLSLLEHFESKEEIRELLKIEPDWSMLDDQEVVEKLFQIGRHYDLVQIVQPKSVEDLCDVIALLRPGKKYLSRIYREDKERVRRELFTPPKDPEKYYFKRAHALAYAHTLVLNMHLVSAGIL